MLVITRKAGQKVFVGDNIIITIVRIKGDRVRLGIQAPTRVPIKREELKATPPRREAGTQSRYAPS